MEKIKGSLIAKISAWLLISVTGIVMTISFIIGCFFAQNDVYRANYAEEEKKNLLTAVGKDYAIKVMRDREEGTNLEYFKNTNFRYGLIKTDDIEKIDWNHAAFLESNLPGKINKDELEIYHMPVNAYTKYYFDESIWNGFSNNYTYESQTTAEWNSWYVDAICFDSQSGIFYYHTEEKNAYYPVKEVSISFEGETYNYTYNQGKKEYDLKFSERSVSDAEEDFYTADQRDEIVQILENEEGMNFARLDETVFDHEHWNEMVFDSIREYNAEEEPFNLIQIYANTQLVSDTEDYYLDSYYTLHTCEKNDSIDSSENFYVAVLQPTDIQADLNGDLYEKRTYLLNFTEKYKYSVWGIFAGAAFLTLILFIFLMWSAGYKKHALTKELYLKQSFMQRVPLEIEGTVYCILSVTVLGFATLFFSETNIYAAIAGATVFGLAFAWLTIGLLVNFAVRVKIGKWWTHTIIYCIYHKIKGLAKWICGRFAAILHNRKLIWKFWILFLAYKFIESILILLFELDLGVFVLFTMLEAATFGIFSSFCIIQMQQLQDAGHRIARGEYEKPVDVSKMYPVFKEHGENLNHIGEGITIAVNERMKSERFKTELITNVSHDIKTPLTSIINYVDLLEKEELHNEKAAQYLEILERQSSKLKKLIEDLVEASKASSGNLPVTLEKLDLNVFLTQTVGEWSERLEQEKLELVVAKPDEPVYIDADGRHLWRVVDNLFNNICKYAQPGSRVYISIEKEESGGVQLVLKNISKYQLNISAEELLERFVQGDKSRNSTGHGLGLSIAQSLMNLMDGNLKLAVDGDLFKVILSFTYAYDKM